jgi:tetratricopeptide (TPR) repeat protein
VLKKLTWANLKVTLATWIGSGTIAGAFTALNATGAIGSGGAPTTWDNPTNGRLELSWGAYSSAQLNANTQITSNAKMSGGVWVNKNGIYGALIQEFDPNSQTFTWSTSAGTTGGAAASFVQRMQLSSSSLAITGAISAVHDINVTGTTASSTFRSVNTGGTTFWGTDSSVGTDLNFGVYNSGVYRPAGTSFVLGMAGNNQFILGASGDLLVGASTGTGHRFARSSGAEATLVHLTGDGTSGWSVYTYRADSEAFNAANTCMKVAKNTSTSRSINAAGTINASGADYAEYEHNNGLAIAKGNIVGFKADGTLTDTYADAIRFGVKSTNPSYVGGDTWGSDDAVGKRPEAPQFVAPEYTGSADPGDEPVAPVAPAAFTAVAPDAPGADATELEAFLYSVRLADFAQAVQTHAQAVETFEQSLAAYSIALVAFESARHIYTMDQAEHAARVEVAQALFDTATMPEYERALAAFEAALEAERQKVDRIAYSGKVPCNVTGAVPGGYIIAVATDDGFISGRFVPDPDFAQYKKAVGRVNRILPDGRCEVAVMVH